ncbi:pol-like protein ens-3 [Limosa lapponica baueri]|uniref:Pol-like protein ens-3 n=1 Tax=Limosa lapponica baueri TaxID=1758121 RepID=A0A2I0U688_LIMLA|nr:pol-like protein ens-3 [Limosa lapponica baueri]
MRKDFSHPEGETLISWLLRCWDNGANTIDLEGREARQLGNLAMEDGGEILLFVYMAACRSRKEKLPSYETTSRETEHAMRYPVVLSLGLWRGHEEMGWTTYLGPTPRYSQIVKPLYEVTQKKNDFTWGPEKRQAFEEIKQEIVHAVALGPVQTGQDIKNVLYTTAGDNGPTWILWQKAPEETGGRPLGFWSPGYRRSEANCTLN